MAPVPKPYTTSAAASVPAFAARPGRTTDAAQKKALSGTMTRAPKRSVSGPETCIPAKAPAPSTSRSQPSTAWSMPTRCSTLGMWTTHMPIRKPFRAK